LFSRLTKTMPTLSVANVMTIYFKSTTRGQNRQKAVWWCDLFRLPIPVIVMLFTIWDVRNRRHRQWNEHLK